MPMRQTPSGMLGFWPSWAHHIGDLVFGANDGIVTTFAVVSGGLGCLLVVALVAWRIPELRRYRLGTLRT